MQPQSDSGDDAGVARRADQMPMFSNPLQQGCLDDPYAHYAEPRAGHGVHHGLSGLPIRFAHTDIRQDVIDPTAGMNASTVISRRLTGRLPVGVAKRREHDAVA